MSCYFLNTSCADFIFFSKGQERVTKHYGYCVHPERALRCGPGDGGLELPHPDHSAASPGSHCSRQLCRPETVRASSVYSQNSGRADTKIFG